MGEPLGHLPSSRIYHSDERVNEFVKEAQESPQTPRKQDEFIQVIRFK